MENITAAVEYDLGDPLLGGTPGYHFADLACGFLVSAIACELFVQRGGCCKRYPCNIVNDLGVDVFGGAEYIQAWAFCCARNFAAHPAVAVQPGLVCVSLVHHL
ncbi:protein of unknown function [Ruminococcaceae bacterium BL-6]|nr:protein of unknown function [Ruminococcaceae bacterium BL-6]